MSHKGIVAVFGSSRTEEGSPDWREAEQVGALLAESGFSVVTGGYGGTMEAALKGAAGAGGHTIGVTAARVFPDRSGANQFVAEEIPARSLPERIGMMLDMAVGSIAMPGAIGTAAELILAWNENDVNRRGGRDTKPAIAVGEPWRAVADALISTGADGNDVTVVSSGAEAARLIIRTAKI